MTPEGPSQGGYSLWAKGTTNKFYGDSKNQLNRERFVALR